MLRHDDRGKQQKCDEENLEGCCGIGHYVASLPRNSDNEAGLCLAYVVLLIPLFRRLFLLFFRLLLLHVLFVALLGSALCGTRVLANGRDGKRQSEKHEADTSCSVLHKHSMKQALA